MTPKEDKIGSQTCHLSGNSSSSGYTGNSWPPPPPASPPPRTLWEKRFSLSCCLQDQEKQGGLRKTWQQEHPCIVNNAAVTCLTLPALRPPRHGKMSRFHTRALRKGCCFYPSGLRTHIFSAKSILQCRTGDRLNVVFVPIYFDKCVSFWMSNGYSCQKKNPNEPKMPPQACPPSTLGLGT